MINVKRMLCDDQCWRIWTEKSTRPINEGHHALDQQFTFWSQDPFIGYMGYISLIFTILELKLGIKKKKLIYWKIMRNPFNIT